MEYSSVRRPSTVVVSNECATSLGIPLYPAVFSAMILAVPSSTPFMLPFLLAVPMV